MTEMPPGFDPGTNPKAAAKAAKAYAKASRPWYQKKRVIIPAAIVVFAIMASAMSGGDDSDPDPKTSGNESTDSGNGSSGSKDKGGEVEKSKAPETKKADPKPQYMKVSAEQLLKEFEENELKGDAKYKGKSLEVSGVVDKIDTDIWDDDKYVLRIGSGGDWDILTVDCYDMSTDALSKLNTGQKVTVHGDFKDGGDLGVELDSCTVA